MENKMKTINDIWKLPFKKDSGGYACYIYDSDMNICFDYLYDDNIDEYDRIVGLLNGDVVNYKKFDNVVYDDENIYVSDGNAEPHNILLVRGWGLLTGALKLSFAEAIKLQKELIAYCSDKLKGKQS